MKFLAEDATKWRNDRGCATCHHGTMTVWALSEAESQGYAVPADSLKEIVRWTKDQFAPRWRKPRDPRPGWSLVSVPAIYLGVMAQNLPILSRDEIGQIASHLARHQEDDGTWEMPPAANGAPPIWESRETLALWALLAWEPTTPADPAEAGFSHIRREKTIAWLSNAQPTDTVQSIALRLLLDARTGKAAEQLQPRIDQLLKRQKSDGGWSQHPDLPSDAFATGQTMYALNVAGVKNDREEIVRAVAFLVATQKDDGSWPMTSRNHPGVETTRNPIRNPVPITYFGSAWGTLGLVRSVPPAADSPARQQQAFDKIRGYHGKHEVDEQNPQRPVVGVDLRYYELDDQEVADFVDVLLAFPQLRTLQFKSAKITDAGLPHLNRLPQLRRLSLANATITDAGLSGLKTLGRLEELNLKGTKVTDAGVQELRQAFPQLKVER
ncbi:MAG TPA: prenyltransferase/squalene oxidase repeat-containing protein [Planctomycetaceae bacterium]|nr:prenyltransferase/squalene oxidase repeat-containing protein [Planctomycetaceae bacterium]